MDVKPLLLFFHVVGIVVWVGGMFFAYVCLRPVAAALLQPPQRLPLWGAVFDIFLKWVWLAVLLILASGLTMFLAVGHSNAPLYYHLMFGLGIAMMLIFGQVYFAPYQRLRRAVAAQDWPAGGAALGQIRKLVSLNLVLGLITIAIATLGRGF